MKKTIAVGAVCACLGIALGAWAAPPKSPHPKLITGLSQLEAALQDIAGAPPDPSGHLKKAADYTRKATDELREAMGMGHNAHSHDEK